jgi:hypothetical protein
MADTIEELRCVIDDLTRQARDARAALAEACNLIDGTALRHVSDVRANVDRWRALIGATPSRAVNGDGGPTYGQAFDRALREVAEMLDCGGDVATAVRQLRELADGAPATLKRHPGAAAMKLDDILAAARRQLADHEHCGGTSSSGKRCDDARATAQFIIELLEAKPAYGVTVEATHAQHLGSNLFLRIRGIKDWAIVPDGVCYALATDASAVAAAILRAREEGGR